MRHIEHQVNDDGTITNDGHMHTLVHAVTALSSWPFPAAGAGPVREWYGAGSGRRAHGRAASAAARAPF